MQIKKNTSSQVPIHSPSHKDHIVLGKINPPHSYSNDNLKPKYPSPPLQIHSKPFHMENRTHYENQLQNKDSLPQRLRQPRVYVQRIVPKYQRGELILPSKRAGSNQYEMTVRLFKKIGESLPQKTKKCLTDLIIQFNSQNQYSKPLTINIFFNRQQFLEFIVQNFKKFSYEEAQIFWNLSYNQLRFKDRISMNAFVFNFNKFYLQTENFNNMFSQTALRQRLIDIRVALIDWANNDVALKFNMRKIRDIIQNIEKDLKISQSQDMLCDFHIILQNCKNAHIKLKFLSEVLFNLTDNKNFNQQKIKTSLHLKIQEKIRKLKISREVIKNFFQTNDYSQNQQFPITDILQFCKADNVDQQIIAIVISWMQGLFDYLYYNKPQDKQLGLTLNLQTKRLQCANILHTNAKIIRQYDKYLENLCQQYVAISKDFMFAIDDGLKKMPDLEGPKKSIVECNFMSQVALRFIRFVDLNCFCILNQIINSCLQQTNFQQISSLLTKEYKQQQIKKCMKKLFTLIQQQQDNRINLQLTQKSTTSKLNKIQAAVKKFNKLKQQPLLLKLKKQAKKQTEQNQQNCPQQQQINNINIKKEQIKKNENQIIQIGGRSFCPHYYKYNLQISRQTNETISAVESLESRLFQLLQFD